MLRRIAIGCFVVAAATAAELPVKKVVLYKHGVGYFERVGQLGPGESARLDFKAAEMNDVLKSLTLRSGGGGVTALRYDASEPVGRKLEKYPFRLGGSQTLSGFLDQLKGERLELRFGSESVSGVIIGARPLSATAETPEKEQVTLLLDSGDLVTRDLGAASAVRFPEPGLQAQLKDYLGVLSGARSQESRSVYIDSTDAGERQIRASYMIPAAVWKSSYRLIFGSSGEPTLEGWAIVDNTTGDDWTKVNLALVSGRPISFVSRLYEPKYVIRPEAELPEDQAVAPVVHAGVVGGVAGDEEMRAELKAGRRDALRQRAMAESMAAPPLAPRPAPAAAPSSVVSTTVGRDLGELFEYGFEQPVTVRKNESAMLPFLQDKIAARKLLIYSDTSSRHPMNAAELTNSTGKTLDGGPITVFDSGAYAGEALTETLKAGDKRLISYGVDLGTRVTTAFDSDQARVSEVHVRRGVLTAKSSIRETRTYTINNVDEAAKTLIVEHPARPGYKLLNREPGEKTPDAYRFEVKLAGGATGKFAVEEERELVNTHGLMNQSPDFLVSFVRNKELSEEAREQLGRVISQQRQIAGTGNEIGRLETEINELTNDQNRIRQNISSLNRVSGQQEQVQKYAGELASQESRLAGLRDELNEARSRMTTLQSELNRLIETMEF